jgi:hypothetical protein
MTEKDKRAAIIIGVGIIAILLFLFWRGRGGLLSTAGNTVVNGAPFSLPAVGGISLGPIYYGDDGFTYTIPGLDLSGPDLSMIGACCSDCMQGGDNGAYDPYSPNGGPSYVYNMGDSGPTVYNYYQEAPSSSGYNLQFGAY